MLTCSLKTYPQNRKEKKTMRKSKFSD